VKNEWKRGQDWNLVGEFIPTPHGARDDGDLWTGRDLRGDLTRVTELVKAVT
jgi:hypothetical protein